MVSEIGVVVHTCTSVLGRLGGRTEFSLPWLHSKTLFKRRRRKNRKREAGEKKKNIKNGF